MDHPQRDMAPHPTRRLDSWSWVSYLASRANTPALLVSLLVVGQEPRGIVAKDAISVRRVERGTMLLRETVSGSITSLAPARATVALTAQQATLVRAGQTCSAQVVAPSVLHGKVLRVQRDSLDGQVTAELALTDSLARGVSIGDRIGALIDVGTAHNILYFDRPSTARPDMASNIFLLEPDGKHAKRTVVLYGRMSGSQLEIKAGLAPGDRVIVTDLSEMDNYNRVTLK
jgi:voltage-gated potassium channel Kch